MNTSHVLEKVIVLCSNSVLYIFQGPYLIMEEDRSMYGKALGSQKNYSGRNKSLYAVTEVLPGGTKQTTVACAVKEKRNKKKYQLMTWRKAEQNDAQDIIADRYCSQYSEHLKKHRIEFDSPLEGTGLTFIPLKDKPDKHLKLVGQDMLNESDRELIKQGFSAYMFIERAVVQLDFKRSQGKYKLTKINPDQQEFDEMSAIGAPIIMDLGRAKGDRVIGVVGLSGGELCPVFLKEAGIEIGKCILEVKNNHRFWLIGYETVHSIKFIVHIAGKCGRKWNKKCISFTIHFCFV